MSKSTEPAIFVDVHSSGVTDILAKSPLFEKTATVTAVQITEAEHVVTAFGDFIETERDAVAGQWKVTNPDGEQYILDDEVFKARYKALGKDKYQAIGFIRATSNPWGVPIEITAPWGEPQFGDEDCIVAVSVLNGEPVWTDRYIIERKAFENTYASVTA